MIVENHHTILRELVGIESFDKIREMYKEFLERRIELSEK